MAAIVGSPAPAARQGRRRRAPGPTGTVTSGRHPRGRACPSRRSAVPAAVGSAEGATSPEPLRHQDRAGRATLEGGRPTEGSCTRQRVPAPAGAPQMADQPTRRPSPNSQRGTTVRRAPHRHRRARRPAADAGGDRLRVHGRAARRRSPGEHPRAARARRCRAPASEPEAAAELRALAARNQVLTSMIGLGYYGTDHPAGDPAQRPGEPRLVHRVHAVPARDQPGPARGAAQLPDDGRGPHRAAGRRTRRCSTRAPPPPRRWRSRTAASRSGDTVRRRRRRAARRRSTSSAPGPSRSG